MLKIESRDPGASCAKSSGVGCKNMSKTNRRSAAVKRGYRALLIPVISITLISSCSTPVMTDKPGTTFGVIKVGSPRVSSRERLLNERLARDTWLTAQRDAVDEKQFGFQGISDIRDMVGIIARVGVEADPLKVKKFRLQSETDIEKLKGAKQADDVKRQNPTFGLGHLGYCGALEIRAHSLLIVRRSSQWAALGP